MPQSPPPTAAFGGLGSSQPSLEAIDGLRAEYERCVERGSPVVFLHVGVDGIDVIERFRGPAGKQDVLDAVAELVRSAPRNGELYSWPTSNGLAVMLTETPGEAGEILARILVEGARELALPGGRTLKVNLCVGLATTQQDEVFFETMLQVAEEGSSVASASGGGCFAHTQLYGLHQRRLEREMPDRRLVAPGRKHSGAARTGAATSTGGALPGVANTSHAPAAKTAEPATPALPVTRTVDEDTVHTEPTARPTRVPAAVDLESEMALLHERLREVLAADRAARGVTTEPAEAEEIEQQVLGLADRWSQVVLEKSLAAQESGHRERVEQLERRITKLNHALEDTERELLRVAQAASVDHGLHSAYRHVQGLSPREGNFETKIALMGQLLEANLQLYSRISLNN